MSVKNKTIVILGAGGSAQAIYVEAKKRKAKVFLLNRTKEKAKKITSKYGHDLSYIKKIPNYDVIINATSASFYNILPIKEKYLLPNKLAVDLVYSPSNTLFLKAAKNKGCSLIFGIEIYKIQALAQGIAPGRGPGPK